MVAAEFHIASRPSSPVEAEASIRKIRSNQTELVLHLETGDSSILNGRFFYSGDEAQQKKHDTGRVEEAERGVPFLSEIILSKTFSLQKIL